MTQLRQILAYQEFRARNKMGKNLYIYIQVNSKYSTEMPLSW